MPTGMRCPNCGQAYALTPEQAPQYAGRTITCTNCNKPFVAQVPGVPGAGASPGSPPSMPYATPVGAAGHDAGDGAGSVSNGLAIGSLVTGIVGLCVPLLGIVAVVLGIFGLRKTNDPRVGGRGLAIAGISIGAVSLITSLLLPAILLPSLNRAREQANRVKCASNLRQIGLAIQMYANQNGGQFPPDFATMLSSQGLPTNILVCPSTTHTPAASTAALAPGQTLSYVYVGKGLTDKAPSTAIIAYEAPANHNPGPPRAGAGGNFLFADGHVEYVSNAQPIIAALQAGQNPPPMPGGTGGAGGTSPAGP